LKRNRGADYGLKDVLHESEQKYRALVENSSETIFSVDLEGRITYLSPAIETVAGYKPEELVGKKFALFIVAEDLPGLMVSFEHTLSGMKEPYEFRIQVKDGSVRCVQTSSSVLFKDGRVAGIIGVLNDLTDRKRAEEQLKHSMERLQGAISGVIQAMAVTVEMRDPFTAGHQQRVSELAAAIAREMELPADRAEGIRIAGLIHDIGKVAVPSEILSKPSALPEPESTLIRIHPEAGFNILKNIDFPWPIARVVLQHHERLDGSGYPSGLAGEGIILEARILGVADVVEAAASHRPYRQAQGVEFALDEISRNAGVLYDSAAAAACLKLFREKGFAFSEKAAKADTAFRTLSARR